MKITNSSGSITEPWGTPLITSFQSDGIASTLTHCYLPLRNDLTRFNKSPAILTSLCKSLSSAMESKALGCLDYSDTIRL